MPVTVIQNPIMQHKLGLLRDVNTPSDSFRRAVSEMSVQLFYEAASDLPLVEKEVTSPFSTTRVKRAAKSVTLIALMRAGNGMMESILDMWSEASVGFIGIYRDKFLKNTVEYYFKMPIGIADSAVFVLDPIIATGDTAIASVDRLKETGCTDIRYLSVLTSAQGKDALIECHPDVHLYAVSVTDEVNDDGYIVPGIGDVGSRYYNTR